MYTDESASTIFPAGMDPAMVVQAFDAAWNAHDVERVLKFFAADAVVRFMYPPPFPEPDTYTGQDEIRRVVEGYLEGKFQMQSHDYQVAGDQMTWRYHLAADRLRRLGVDEVEGAAGATFAHGKMLHFTLSFSPASTAEIVAGLDRAGIPGPISEGVAGAGEEQEEPADSAGPAPGTDEPRPHRGPTWDAVGTEDHQLPGS